MESLSLLRNSIISITRARVARLAAMEAVNHYEEHVPALISSLAEAYEQDRKDGARAAAATDVTADAVFRRAMDLVASRESLIVPVGSRGWRVRQPEHVETCLALMLVWHEFCANVDLTAAIPNYEEDISGSERALSPLVRLYDAIRAEIVERVARRASVERWGVFALRASCEVCLEPGGTKLVSVDLPQPMPCSTLILDWKRPGWTVHSVNGDSALQVRGGEASLERELAQPPTVVLEGPRRERVVRKKSCGHARAKGDQRSGDPPDARHLRRDATAGGG